MPNDLFNGNEGASFTDMEESCKPVWKKSFSRWVIEKPLGECAEVEKNGKNVVFRTEVLYDNPDIFTTVLKTYPDMNSFKNQQFFAGINRNEKYYSFFSAGLVENSNKEKRVR